MTYLTNENDYASTRVLENDTTVPLDPIIYGPKPTPNANPFGNLFLFVGIGVFVLIGICIATSVNETQKDPSERDSWFTALVDYSVEKQKREGRAPQKTSGSYGPFSH